MYSAKKCVQVGLDPAVIKVIRREAKAAGLSLSAYCRIELTKSHAPKKAKK